MYSIPGIKENGYSIVPNDQSAATDWRTGYVRRANKKATLHQVAYSLFMIHFHPRSRGLIKQIYSSAVFSSVLRLLKLATPLGVMPNTLNAILIPPGSRSKAVAMVSA